jgi:RNA polymerase sigma-70 factor (ECF subfamily)
MAMATSSLRTVLENLRRSMLRHDGAGLTDGELLEGFISQRDGGAFEALVGRHGPMVLGVCRRVLGNEADAEDAFQATFLVLVRKAAFIRPRGMVGNWLYGVAHKAARKAKALNERRRAKEKEAVFRPKPEPFGEDQQQRQALLHQELRTLPDKYRAAIVLCDLEAKSIKEAARQLGCPPGTIGTRLARGRGMLARRLARQGLILSGGGIAILLSPGAASAGVPLTLVASTVQAASRIAAGQAASGMGYAQAAALAKGMVKAMSLKNCKIVVALLAVGAISSLGVFTSTPAGLRLTGPVQAGQQKDARAAENILQNPGFEEGDQAPAHWSQGAEVEGVEYIWDKEKGKRGKASLCLHKTAERFFPVAQWHQVVDRKGDKPALRVTAQVKAEGVTKAIIDVIFLDGDGEWVEHKWACYIGAKEAKDPPADHDWKEYAGRVEIPPAARKIQIGLQIYGPGKVWFDEVHAAYAK